MVMVLAENGVRLSWQTNPLVQGGRRILMSGIP